MKSLPFSNVGLGSQKEYLIENLSMLLASGMGVLTALEAIKQGITSKRLQEKITTMQDEIKGGSPIWQALERAGFFQSHAVALIKIGEKTGRLTENLKVIAIQEQKERSFRSKLISATMYPIFVMGVTVFVGIGIAWFILPKLAVVFRELKLELPFITKVLIQMGLFLEKYGNIVIPLLLFVILLLGYFLFAFKKTKFMGQRILFAIPPVKKLISEVEISRFGFILGTLLQAGLPVIESLDSLQNASDFYSYKNLYKYLRDRVEEGNSFQKSFALYPKSKKLIPMPIQQLLFSAEQSGSLPQTLTKIGEMYEEKTETTTKNLTVLLEPILLVIVWLGVVSVALAVILPLYSLIGGLNSGGDTSTPPPVQVEESKEASPSAELQTATESALPVEKQVEILETGTGNLNVRSEPSTTGRILAKVKTGETYVFTQKEEEWYQVVVSDEITGWVNEAYVEEIE